MVPDEDYLRKEEAGEKERLAKKVAALSDSDRQKIVARGELVAVLTCAVLPPCTILGRKSKTTSFWALVEAAALGSPSLIVLMVSVDVEQR